jgi:NADH-quinone oxidoreductase subunit N
MNITQDLLLALPEIFLLSALSLVLLLDLALPDKRRYLTYFFSQLSLLLTFALVLWQYTWPEATAFSGMYSKDALSLTAKAAVLLVSLFVLAYGRSYLVATAMERGEYYLLSLLGILGMLILVSSQHLLTLYLGLELLSLALYALVAFARDRIEASEAGIKYFVLGAVASGFLLYGMSLLYGLSGSLALPEIAEALAAQSENPAVLLVLVFFIVATLFKLGVAPFHMWLPDVYQGAPLATTIYLSAAPKIAALVLLLRLFQEVLTVWHGDWQLLFLALAVLSLVLGNLLALVQTQIKRLLAYSAIAHMGFVLLAVAPLANGYEVALFYAVVYALLSAGTLGALLLLTHTQNQDSDAVTALAGLGQRAPWLAFMLLILLFAQAGIPPTIGFYAKFFVLNQLVEAGFWFIALTALIFSVIGAFYYLRLIKTMYMDKAESTAVNVLHLDAKILLSVNGLAALFLGFFPGVIWWWLQSL